LHGQRGGGIGIASLARRNQRQQVGQQTPIPRHPRFAPAASTAQPTWRQLRLLGQLPETPAD